LTYGGVAAAFAAGTRGRGLQGQRSMAGEALRTRVTTRPGGHSAHLPDRPGRNKSALEFGSTVRANKTALRKPLACFTKCPVTATWRSGYAAVCKTVYPGSIPGVASTRGINRLGDREGGRPDPRHAAAYDHQHRAAGAGQYVAAVRGGPRMRPGRGVQPNQQLKAARCGHFGPPFGSVSNWSSVQLKLPAVLGLSSFSPSAPVNRGEIIRGNI
jgi:hypothetical protein